MDRFFIKEPSTFEEQLNVLSSRGCIIHDSAFCTNMLSRVSYYRLSAYFLPFKNKDDTYRGNISFERIFRIYEFDRVNTSIRNNATTPFVRHHNKKYAGQFPLWVIVELFTFGMLSCFFADMKQSDQRALTQLISGSMPQDTISWLRCCTDLRNMCAHYGRLYYRIFPAIPASLPQGLLPDSNRRLFGAIWALKNLFPDKMNWKNEFVIPLSMLITEYEKDIDLKHIGFPYGWEARLLQ
jgi:abortive infection bacteriophage resistance protein